MIITVKGLMIACGVAFMAPVTMLVAGCWYRVIRYTIKDTGRYLTLSITPRYLSKRDRLVITLQILWYYLQYNIEVERNRRPYS